MWSSNFKDFIVGIKSVNSISPTLIGFMYLLGQKTEGFYAQCLMGLSVVLWLAERLGELYVIDCLYGLL